MCVDVDCQTYLTLVCTSLLFLLFCNRNKNVNRKEMMRRRKMMCRQANGVDLISEFRWLDTHLRLTFLRFVDALAFYFIFPFHTNSPCRCSLWNERLLLIRVAEIVNIYIILRFSALSSSHSVKSAVSWASCVILLLLQHTRDGGRRKT